MAGNPTGGLRHRLRGAFLSIAPGWVGHRIDKGEDDPHDGEQPW
jgi:hypothetical protein